MQPVEIGLGMKLPRIHSVVILRQLKDYGVMSGISTADPLAQTSLG